MNLNKEEAIKKINEGDNNDFLVFTPDEHTTFLNNFKDSEIEKNIKERISQVHKQYDDDMFDVLGVRKDVATKTYDFLKSQFTALKGDIETKEGKIKELEKALDEKGGNNEQIGILKQEVESLKAKHQEKMEEWKDKYDGVQKTSEQSRILNEFDRSLTGVKFKDAKIIPEDVRSAMIEKAKANLLGKAKFVDDKLAFDDGKGDVLRDDKLNPMTAQELLKVELKSIIDEGHTQTGVDVQDPKKVTTEDGKKIIKVTIPDTVKDMGGLIDHLMAAGIKRTDDEYYPSLDYYREQLGIKED